MFLIWLLFFVFFPLFCQGVPLYKVIALRLSNDTVVSKFQGSDYDYNYNAAIYQEKNGNFGLLVRCQNLKNAGIPFDVGQSYIVYSNLIINPNGSSISTPPKISKAIPTKNENGESCGTEDPRISLLDDTYYLFYTAYDCKRAMLSVMTTKTPSDPSSWTRGGFVLPGRNWSKSGAVLFKTKDNGLSQHYLFWGDSSTPNGGIGICVSSDGKTWNDTGEYLLKIRNGTNPFFDSDLVESGPSPIQLKTGDFLFIYNSAQRGFPSVKPNWNLQYNVGYAILNKSDPTNVIQRSNNPILSPATSWEIGNDKSTNYLTPNVVFLEGMIKDPNGCPKNVGDLIGSQFANNSECFIAVYGGSDSDLGAVRIIASYVDQQTTTTTTTTTTTAATTTTATENLLPRVVMIISSFVLFTVNRFGI